MRDIVTTIVSVRMAYLSDLLSTILQYRVKTATRIVYIRLHLVGPLIYFLSELNSIIEFERVTLNGPISKFGFSANKSLYLGNSEKRGLV